MPPYGRRLGYIKAYPHRLVELLSKERGINSKTKGAVKK